MRRRRRAPTTQLARAGERTYILTNDADVKEIRFRATVLDGTPTGRVEIESGKGLPRTQALEPENVIDATGMTRLALVPDKDTAITFTKQYDAGSFWAMIGGMIFVAVAVGWTAWDFLGG